MSRKSHAHDRPSVHRARSGRVPKRKWRTAAGSDRHELYELSVQEPEAECDLVDQAWKERRGRKCRSIREDFCGTAAVCREWVKRSPKHTAIGVDLDQSVMDWGMVRGRKHLSPKQLARIQLFKTDVRSTRTKPVDSVLAMNFSYFIFKTRDELRKYFKAARQNLVKDGLFLLDAYGGSDSYLEIEEDRNLSGFTYIWDQSQYNPISNHVVNHIHFEFPDGTKMKKAFTYEWRLWSLPEIREVLLEAGFKRVTVYWEGTDKKTGDGNGVWKADERGEACQGWVAYLVAEK